MKLRLQTGLAFALCVWLAACATPGTSPVRAGADAANTVAARKATDAVVVGRSTKADLIATLGKTTVVSFDSGYEVWVYQIIGDRITEETATRASWVERILHSGSEQETSRGRSEFVILFDPSGTVTKTRIRPAPAAGRKQP
ncbi:MAG: hypothetical protein IH604_11160 [Burkholderiales bacterium]|nr:hypothetical protein [Burkholderiales bacterium]